MRKGQRGYLLVMVVVMLFLVASIAMLLNYDSAISANTSSSELDTARAEYVAQAGMQNALWRAQNNACMGSATIPTTALGSDSYTAAITGAAAGTAYTLAADQDAWIRNDDVTKNNGGTPDQHIRFESGNIEQALTRFDLSSLPADAQINSAIAWFYITPSGPGGGAHPEGPITVHRVTADWIESGVTGATWENMNGNFESSKLATIPAQPDDGIWISFNLTGQVQAWVNGQPNYGILMASTAEGVHAKYASIDGGAGERAYLDVVVGSGTASPVNIQATGILANGNTRSLTRLANLALQPSGTYTFQPDATDGIDAYIWEAQKTTNKGTDDETWVSRTSNNASLSLLKFNMGEIPARSKILSATLSLHNRSGNNSNVPVTAHRIINPWNEAFVTWNNRDSGTTWDAAGGDVDPTVIASTNVGPTRYVRYEWDISSLVQGWVDGAFANYGVALATAMASSVGERFDTSDHSDPTRRPRLTITYACECGSACMAPQGSGSILMVVADKASLSSGDQITKSSLESWGYTVNPISDNVNQNSFNAEFAVNDVVYVSESIDAIALSSKLDAAPIGIVSADGDLNNRLGISSEKGTPVGHTLDVVDTSHYVTRVFPAGALQFKTVDTGLSSTSGTKSPDAKVLATAKGQDALVALETGGISTKGGSVTSRRVLLPVGDSNVSWSYLTNNGQLVVQRSLVWAMNADGGGSAGKAVLLVVGDATNLTVEQQDKKALIEGWGHTVKLIATNETQAAFDTAAALVDVVYIPELGATPMSELDTKADGLAVGVITEEARTAIKLGSFSLFPFVDTTSINIVDNTHYITGALPTGNVVLSTATQSFWKLAGTLAPDLHVLGQLSGPVPGLAYVDVGETVNDGNPAAGRRIKLPWGSYNFDVNLFTDDALEIMKRAIEWGAGAGVAASPGYDVLLIVGNDTTLASKDVGYKALMESWGHTVAVIDDGASQADYDTAMAAADVIYASGSAVGSSMLDKATYTTKGVVNEVPGKIDNFGFSSVKSATANFDAFSTTNATHYITETFGGNPVTVFTSSLTNPVPGGTLAPDLQNVGEVSGTPSLVTLDAGATGWNSNPVPGRRAHLPFASAETTDMTADGKTILQRALEWAAGAGSGGDGGGGGAYIEKHQSWIATSDNTWQTFDLSTFGVPADAVVEVAITNSKDKNERWGGVRAIGSALERRFRLHEAEGGGVDAMVMHVQANSSSQVQHFAEKKGEVTFTVLGYWTNATYVERFDSFSAGGSNSWRAHNLSAYGVGPSQVAEIAIINTNASNERLAGVRPSGSSMQRLISIHEAESGGIDAATMMVNADASGVAEVYAASDADIDFYVLGYWSDPPGTFVETGGVSGQVSTLLTWEANDLSTFGVPADSVAQFITSNESGGADVEIGVRQTGSSLNRLFNLQEAEDGRSDLATMHVNVDASSRVEWYAQYGDGLRFFYPIGWWVLN